MAFLNVSLVGTGTLLSYEDPDTPDTWIPLPNAVSVGSSSDKGSFVDNSPIASPSQTYIAGDEETEQKQIMFNDIPGDAVQEQFLAHARNKRTVNIRLDFPNNRRLTHALVMNGTEYPEPARGEALKVGIVGQRTGSLIVEEI